MRCFTDEELERGIAAVVVSRSRSHLLEVFLEAARPQAGIDFGEAWPVCHPMHCAICARAVTNACGVALVEIWIRDRQWRCAAACSPEAGIVHGPAN